MSIQIKPLSATLFRNTQLLGFMDPYVVCSFNGQSHKTRTHNNGGKQPTWKDTLFFNVNNPNGSIKVEVWDENTFNDSLVGEGFIDIAPILNNPYGSNTHNTILTFQGERAGMVNLNITVINNGNMCNGFGPAPVINQNQEIYFNEPTLSPYNMNQMVYQEILIPQYAVDYGTVVTQNVTYYNNGW